MIHDICGVESSKSSMVRRFLHGDSLPNVIRCEACWLSAETEMTSISPMLELDFLFHLT